MPTVYNLLPDDQVWKILAFIRSLYIGDPRLVWTRRTTPRILNAI